MHATIRYYEGVTSKTEKLAQAVHYIASGLSGAPGFVSFVILEAESGGLGMVSIFEDQHSLREADRLVWTSLPDHLAALLPENPHVITGEIIFQRGL